MDRIEDSKNIELKSNKKKKKHVGLFVTLGIVVLLIAAPVAGAYIAFYDGTTSDIKKQENFNSETVFSDLAVDALDNSKETGEIHFSLTTDIINQMLISAKEKIDESTPQIKEYFTSLSLESNGNTWIFVGDLNLKNIFKTRAKIFTQFSSDDENKQFVFKITDIKIGRVNGLYDTASYFLNKLNIDINDFLSNALTQTGLSFEYDANTKSFIYSYEAVKKDIMSHFSNEKDIYKSIFEQYFADESFTMIIDENGLNGKIILDPYKENKNYQTIDKQYNIDVLDIKQKAEKVFNDNIIPYNEENATRLFDYLVNGHGSITPSFEEIIKDKDLSSIGITNINEYKGVAPKSENENYLKDVIRSHVDITKITTENYISEINEDDLQKELLNANVVGKGFILTRKVEENNYKINFYLMNEFYTNITKNHLSFVIGLSINGYQTNICLDAVYKNCDTSNYTLNFDVSQLYYGNNVVIDEFKNKVYEMFEEGLSKNESLSIDKENQTLSISILDNLELDERVTIETIGSLDAKFSDTLLEEEGKITFVVKKNS